MSLIFNLILITSILVLGWTIASQPNMWLHPVRVWAENKKSKLMMPLFTCHWCQPSVWTALGYVFASLVGVIDSFSVKLIFIYPLVVCGSSFVCGVLWTLYELIDAKSKYYTNVEKLSHWDIINRKKEFQRNGKSSQYS